MRSLKVVCDNPRHARGKVATIVTFTLHEDDDGFFQEHSGDRSRRKGRIQDRLGSSGDLGGFVLRKGYEIPPCKLCGRRLPPLAVRSAFDFKIVVADIIDSGRAVISMSELLAIVGSQARR